MIINKINFLILDQLKSSTSHTLGALLQTLNRQEGGL